MVAHSRAAHSVTNHSIISRCFYDLFLGIAEHYQLLMQPTERGKARRLMFAIKRGQSDCPSWAVFVAKRTIDLETDMIGISMQRRRIRAARRVALLTTAIAGIGGAAVVLAPNMPAYLPAYVGSALAQNLTEKVQQLPQRPVGFADIVEKVKPAVISVRVKIDRPADQGLNSDDGDLPFPPGSPFDRFFKRFGVPNGVPQQGGRQVITGQGSGFFITSDGYAVT